MKWLSFRLSALGFGLALAAIAASDVHFQVSYDKAAFAGPFSGRVVVYVSKKSAEPRFGPDWMSPDPEFSAKVIDLKPGQAAVIDSSNATSFPAPPSALPPGSYTVQAVVDRNLGGRSIGSSPGNLYSKPIKIDIDASQDVKIDIVCDQVVSEPKFKETGHIKLARIQSALLTKFYGRPTYMNAAVMLPEDWASHADAKYPVEYNVPGFGGSYTDLSGRDVSSPQKKGVSFLFVYLDPNCPTGHCVFADSGNNGPWGEALTTEFIPYIEKTFRAIGDPGARFVGGHSSGGWSSLWLQVQYPDFFGGVFSTSPDPVDFHAFQLIDLYKAGANIYHDASGKPIPVGRFGDKLLLSENFAHMEEPIRGEQFGSFNAVFSPKGKDGEPVSMWDPKTGAVRPEVVEAWKKYDIGLKLRTNWKTLGPKLKGKLHVWVGTEDTFYLDSAVHLLDAEMKGLGSDAEIGFVPGDHFTMMSFKLHQHIDEEMADMYTAWRRLHPRSDAGK